MRRVLATLIAIPLLVLPLRSQTPQKPEQNVPEDVIRVTTELVRTDVVVTDKNDQVIKDLTLDDFELYENGKKQDLKFMEYVGVDSPRRTEGTRPNRMTTVDDTAAAAGLSAKDLKRVIAFVVDDLT